MLLEEITTRIIGFRKLKFRTSGIFENRKIRMYQRDVISSNNLYNYDLSLNKMFQDCVSMFLTPL